MRYLALAACAALLGCAAHPIHPGTANAFDSDAYDALSIADNVIQSTKADLAAGKLPTAIAGNVKTALNALIRVYDTADTFYCGQPVGTPLMCAPGSYHALAMAGAATPEQSSQLQGDLNQISTATAQLAAAKAGN